MTNQEVFDIVAPHLLKQNSRSEYNDVCRYRHDGKKCAIGVLIPDDEYSENLEGHDVVVVSVNCPSLFNVDVCFLMRLQELHDDHPVEDWKNALIHIATDQRLDYSSISGL